MRIGVVSDTHNNLQNVKRIVEVFNDAAVDRIIHTGDITQPKTVNALADVNAPLYGVFGNNDQGELPGLQVTMELHGFHFIQPPMQLNWAGRQILVIHDPLELNGYSPGNFDVIIHGHTHLETVRHEESCLIFNPGESAGTIKGGNAVGILDLLAMKPEVVRF